MKFNEKEYERQQSFEKDKIDREKNEIEKLKNTEELYLDLCENHSSFYQAFKNTRISCNKIDRSQIKTFYAAVLHSKKASNFSIVTQETSLSITMLKSLEKYITSLDFSINFEEESENRIDSTESIKKLKQMISEIEQLEKKIIDDEEGYVKQLNNEKV